MKGKEFEEFKESGSKGTRGKSRGRSKGNNNRRSNMYNRDRSTKQDNSSVPVYTGSTDNDPSWYVPNGQLIKDVASIPTVFRSGAPVILNTDPVESPSEFRTVEMNAPGIMALYTMPMFGDGHDEYSALNTAANAFFIELRRATSGTSYYEDVDSMLYLLAGANVLSAYAFVVRVYGLINYYKLENAYTPRALVEAMGVDYDDVSTHMADFRAMLNKFAYRLQSIALPKVTDYITRAVFMYENVYTDASSSKAQYYMYSPVGFYQYNEGGDSVETAAGALYFRPLRYFTSSHSETTPDPALPGIGMMSHTELINMLNALLDPILESQDMGYIMADVLKAMGSGAMYSVTPIAETYINAPVYNPEVLAQIENAFIYGYEFVSAGVNQKVEIGRSSLVPYFGAIHTQMVQSIDSKTYNAAAWQMPTLGQFYHDSRIPLNFHYDSVSPENIMVASRLATSGSMLYDFTDTAVRASDLGFSATMQKIAEQPRTCGSDIVVNARLLYYPNVKNSGNQTPTEATFNTKFLIEGIGSLADQTIQYMATVQQLLSTFDWHPRFDLAMIKQNLAVTPTFTASTVWPGGYVAKYSPNMIFGTLSKGSWDLENYAVLSEYELQRMHDIAIWGLFTSKLNVVQ